MPGGQGVAFESSPPDQNSPRPHMVWPYLCDGPDRVDCNCLGFLIKANYPHALGAALVRLADRFLAEVRRLDVAVRSREEDLVPRMPMR